MLFQQSSMVLGLHAAAQAAGNSLSMYEAALAKAQGDADTFIGT